MSAVSPHGPDPRLARIARAAASVPLRPPRGRVVRIVGPLVHATAHGVRLGEVCVLRDRALGRAVPAEVVGLVGETALLTPIGDVAGLSTRTEVVPTGRPAEVPVGPALLGRVIDSFGRPLDQERHGPLIAESAAPVMAEPPGAMDRGLIDRPLPLGVRVLDGLLTCGDGQRMGIFGSPGAGKSVLLAQIVRGTAADAVVVALIGERGREVREFPEHNLQGLRRAVVVVATSDRPAMERVRAAHTATAIAEHFRDRGRRVLLVMDSVTRFARALREIGLAAGEPPTRRGFPPSVFAELPRLLERAGPGRTGSITALYTVMVEGEGDGDPIAEETRSILDGHIALSPKLAQEEHFPAVDVLNSRSRVMANVTDPRHRAAAARMRQLLARHQEVELLLRVGEYRRGTDALADEAIDRREALLAFLRQPTHEITPWSTTVAHLAQAVGG